MSRIYLLSRWRVISGIIISLIYTICFHCSNYINSFFFYKTHLGLLTHTKFLINLNFPPPLSINIVDKNVENYGV